MKIYRYESLTAENVGQLNHLLRCGWQPVRETVVGQPTNSPQILVLLEKAVSEHAFTGSDLIDGVSVEFLQDVMLFETLTVEEIRRVVAVCGISRLEKDATIFTINNAPDAVYVVLSGIVNVFLPDLPVQEARVIQLEAGGVFGESSFFSEAPHTMTASCGSDVVHLLSLNRIAYDELFQSDPAIVLKLTNNVARILAARLQETDQWVWQLLQESQLSQISASWRRFRHRVRGGESESGGFFGI